MPDPGVRSDKMPNRRPPRAGGPPGSGSGSGNTGSSGGSGGSGNAEQDFIDRIVQGVNNDAADTWQEEFAPGFFWQEAVIDRIKEDIKAVAKTYEMDMSVMEGWFAGQQANLIGYLTNAVMGQAAKYGANRGMTDTPAGIAFLFEQARSWVGMQFPAFNQLINGIGPGGGSGSGSGRGSGPRRPTAAQIRAQFDLDQLTQTVNDMSRALVLADDKNARSIARSYVNAIVANPEQELDFETFVRGRILASNRAKTIYKSKPKSLTEEQFLQPYVQAAMQRIGPGFGDQLAQLSIAGAQLNADPNAFQQRLERTSQVQSGAPFLTGLAEQLTGIKDVLR